MMKFIVLALAAATVSVSAVDNCSLTYLATLLADSNEAQCSSDSGYVFTSGVKPTEAQATAMCSSTACKAFQADALATNPTECIIPLGDEIYLLADLLTYVSDICSAASSATSTTSSAASSTTSSATTSATSSATSSTNSSGSTASSTTTSNTSSATSC